MKIKAHILLNLISFNLNFQLFLKAENTTQNSYINRKFLYKQNHDIKNRNDYISKLLYAIGYIEIRRT
jgi:hypothetical protein